MNLYLRLLLAWLRSKRLGTLSPVVPLSTAFRVWPTDLDAFGHMNNGRYLQIMDVARFEWMVRCGMTSAMVKGKWSALLGGTLMRYRYALKPFQPYRVTTQLIFWDELWVYIEHRFINQKGRQVAAGIARAGMRKDGAWVSPQGALDDLFPGCCCPNEPAYLSAWLQAEAGWLPKVRAERARRMAVGKTPSITSTASNTVGNVLVDR